jgi:hypothetical protein
MRFRIHRNVAALFLRYLEEGPVLGLRYVVKSEDNG